MNLNNPITNPRCLTNQRLATVPPNTSAIEPVPIPTTIPQDANNCHGELINIVLNEPTVTKVSAVRTTLRIPKRSMKAAANGAIKPKSNTFTAMEIEISSRRQPNASSSGTTNTEGVARTPAVTTRTKKVTNATGQAGWKEERLIPNVTKQPYQLEAYGH